MVLTVPQLRELTRRAGKYLSQSHLDTGIKTNLVYKEMKWGQTKGQTSVDGD